MANSYNNIGTQKGPVVPSTQAPQGRDIPQVAYENVPAARSKNTGIRQAPTKAGK